MLHEIDSVQTARADKLVGSLKKWVNQLPRATSGKPSFQEALEAVNAALMDTKNYLLQRREGHPRDPETENNLFTLWINVSNLIQPFDNDLAADCMVKGHGWADPSIWSKPQYKNLKIDVDQILERVHTLTRNQPPSGSVPVPIPGWFPVAAALFTLLSLASLFYLIIRPEDLAPGKRIMFNVWVALCVAASVSFIGGSARAWGRLPWLGQSPIRFVAVGGVGVFILTLIVLSTIHN